MNEQAWKAVEAIKGAIIDRLTMEMNFDPENATKALLVWLADDPDGVIVDAALSIYESGKDAGYDEGYDDAESDGRYRRGA